jgi:glycosyltransferase involved in cell wall biosynthesis
VPDRPPRLLLAGRADAAAGRLERLAAELKIVGDMRFLGAVDDVGSLLGACDLGAFSSRREGCPNGVLECMAAGLAIAATDIPGIRDVVGEEGAVLLAPPGDPAALAAKILLAAGDDGLRSRLGGSMAQRAKSDFSVDGMVATTAGILARERGALSPV